MQNGLIGCPLGHSFSKEIHESLGRYPYELKELAPDKLATFLHHKDFKGINVTIPYKQAVIPYLDEISPRAKAIGAVNTIVNRDGRLIGDNTDFDGMRLALGKAGITVRGKNVLILGTGGTSNTAYAVCRSLGAKQIEKVSRTGKGGAISYETAAKKRPDTDILLNTTPCGMYPQGDAQPIDLATFSHLSGVFDAIYRPLCTELVASAKAQGIPAANGLYMLVAQAVRAAERFTGEAFPLDIIDRLYRKTLLEKQNLVLIGMPGVGKTRVGTRLAELLHRPFYDSDKVIAERIGMPIPDYFAANGEAAFRAVETEIISELSKQSGIVLSTGGGAVLKAENVHALRKNGYLLFLDRPVDELKTSSDRPLSSDREKVRALFQVRYPIYLAAADRHILSGKNANETAHIIWEELS